MIFHVTGFTGSASSIGAIALIRILGLLVQNFGVLVNGGGAGTGRLISGCRKLGWLIVLVFCHDKTPAIRFLQKGGG